MKNNPLAKKFSFKQLIKYTLPSVLMMVFMSTYTIVDGIFVSNYVGEQALAAINLVIPVVSVVMAVSLMFATGGNAIIARYMGEGRNQEANSFLTVLYIIGGILGIIATIIIQLYPDFILNMLGTSDALYDFAKSYLLSISLFVTPIIYLVFIQSFLVTAGKPGLGFIICLFGGITNMILDYIFIAPEIMDLSIAGAGLATGVGNALPGIFGLLYFIFTRSGNLHFTKPKFKLKTLFLSMYNGSSELVGSLSGAITMLMFNIIMLKIAGESGLAAISTILYIQQFQTAIYFGFTLGVSPIIAYKYGQGNKDGLHKIVRQSLIFISVISASVIILSLVFANNAIAIFITPTSDTFTIAKTGLLLFLPSYIFMGFNVLFSSLFTALSNGKVSAIISVMRSLVFIVLMLIVLPKILGITGVWLAIPVAECLSIIVALYYYKKNKSVYGY